MQTRSTPALECWPTTICRVQSRAELSNRRELARAFCHQLAEIGALLDAGRIRPVIDKDFPFEQAK
jgi:NADPH:quinone reductase-like Zn-dependent oxidoreductase